MSRLSPIITPKSPRTKTDEELAEACGVALCRVDAIDLAQLNQPPWVGPALDGRNIVGNGRNKAVAAVHAVYGAELELLRLSVLDSPLLTEISEASQQSLRMLSALDREHRARIAHALFEFGGKQRELLAADECRRRQRFDAVRKHARLRELRMSGR